MFCLLSAIILGVLSLFSASHRPLAREALDCVLRRVTFRPCTAGFKEKMKGKIIGRLLDRSPLAARFVHQRFELLSWIFFVLMMLSTVWTIRGGYNYYMYGSCNGLNSTGFCVFDPTGKSNQTSSLSTQCSVDGIQERGLTLDPISIDEFPRINTTAKDTVVFIGCYSCDYTRKAYPMMKRLIDETRARFAFVHFPVKEETTYLSSYAYCVNKEYPERFFEWNERVFQSEKNDIRQPNFVDAFTAAMGIDMKRVDACLSDVKTKEIVKRHQEEITATGIYGTPTIFFNGRAYVGPKPYRVYRNALRHFWFW